MLINLKKVCLTTLLVMSPLFVSADEPNMKLFGTLLIPPPCVIENNNLIEVYFGHNVGIHRVDGINYTQPVNYKLKCDPNIKGWDLGLSIIGPKSQFDDAGLQTNIADLAIHMTRNGEPFILNERFVISPDKPPIIQAVPVKRPGSTLVEGPFEVTATLLAEYQ
ncbi:fimbrial protein [Proteus vulgaris]|uniref:Fimbrial protein n=3 Tax=Morganellaceae TaxID=1903414 RepID=A0A6I7CYL3_9GAMM|nr:MULTISPECIES: fimbrial protein [Proteus]MBG2801554.1 fimbrial protein [Proteus mirabilis]MBG3018297.1 fimbrial protein [Proteus mirabilis]MBG3150972.1 fimbrial protein [Proteus mirabilis]MBI6215381.1 fimbrial protein [Proteus vulgaris]MBI6338688.1 fimbrial protein [Proteus sp. PR00224]